MHYVKRGLWVLGTAAVVAAVVSLMDHSPYRETPVNATAFNPRALSDDYRSRIYTHHLEDGTFCLVGTAAYGSIGAITCDWSGKDH